MHDAAQEAELFSHVASIMTDVILHSSGVPADPLIKVCRAREDVGRMPLLWDFDHSGELHLLYRESGFFKAVFGRQFSAGAAD